jgi:hypothetical protein
MYAMKASISKGYLFLCPPENFQTEQPLSFKWLDCLAYWSLDPSSAKQLSTEDANILGFPSMQLSMAVSGSSWDNSIYARLRQFHQAKGFDPDSQEVAWHLGDRLYQLSSNIPVPFAHSESKVCGVFFLMN